MQRDAAGRHASNRGRYDSCALLRRSRAGRWGGLALELAMALWVVLVICAACVGIGVGLVRLGWPVVGRLAWTLPIWLPGLTSFWIAWRPGDRHEAQPMARLSSVVRGAAMVAPVAVMAANPDAPRFWSLMAMFFGGLVLSFLILGLERDEGSGVVAGEPDAEGQIDVQRDLGDHAHVFGVARGTHPTASERSTRVLLADPSLAP
jgi:hypothetical protein